MRGIPTTYRGHRFRSRIEARWAAFFDLLEWSWAYEPVDLPGYIPDFELLGWHERCLVEVKPWTKREEFAEAERRVLESGWEESYLLLGATPVFDRKPRVLCGVGDAGDAPVTLGYLGGRGAPAEPAVLVCAAKPFWGLGARYCPGGRGLVADTTGYLVCVRCGTRADRTLLAPDNVFDLWGRAGAAVQWKGSRRQSPQDAFGGDA